MYCKIDLILYVPESCCTIQYSKLADAFIKSDIQKLLVDGKKRDNMPLDPRPVSGTL